MAASLPPPRPCIRGDLSYGVVPAGRDQVSGPRLWVYGLTSNLFFDAAPPGNNFHLGRIYISPRLNFQICFFIYSAQIMDDGLISSSYTRSHILQRHASGVLIFQQIINDSKVILPLKSNTSTLLTPYYVSSDSRVWGRSCSTFFSSKMGRAIICTSRDRMPLG